MRNRRELNRVVWCPNCKYFMADCSVDPDEYDLPCESFEDTDHSDHGPYCDEPNDVDQNNPCSFSSDFDWSKWDFDNDPDWR